MFPLVWVAAALADETPVPSTDPAPAEPRQSVPSDAPAPPAEPSPQPPSEGAPAEAAAARSALLSGTVLDADGLSVPGATVAVAGVGAAETDAEGNFRLEVPVGPVDVTVTRPGFGVAQSSVEVPAEGATLAVTLPLDVPDDVGDELTVTSETKAGGTVQVLRERQESAAVTDVVGSEQMSRAGDTDAAAALKRVNGLTVVGGRYVYVRGLGDRYSQTLLDGSSLPSPEPEKRVVPLDLFPTSLLEAVVVQKTFSPELPAEFGGGVVAIRTRSIPEEPVLSLTLSGAWSAGATFEEGRVLPTGPTDWLGFGTDHRALPEPIAAAGADAPLKLGGIFSDGGYTAEDLERFGESVAPRWTPETRVLPPDFGLNFQAGRTWELGDVSFGALGGLVFSNGWSVDEGYKSVYADTGGGLEEKRRTDFVETSNKVRLGGMVSLGLAWGEEGYLRSTTLLNRNSRGTAVEYDADDPTGSNDSRNTRLSWEEQQLLFQQASLGVPLGPLRLATRYAYSLATQAEPDRREYTYLLTDEGAVISQRGTWNDISYTALTDEAHDVGLDLSWPLARAVGESRLAVGGKVLLRERASNVRRFSFEFVGSEGIDLSAPIEEILVADNIGAEEEGDPGYLQLEENTANTDDYSASQEVFAGYALADWAWTKRLRTLAGARVESAGQRVETFETYGAADATVVGELANLDVLPAATVTYGLGPSDVPDAMLVRLGYGRTVSRPELRELSEVPFYDYRTGRLIYGNPDLARATIDNVDLRWEWYPTAGESVSAAAFFKYFDDPIESVVAVSAVSGSVGTFANANSATNVGGEIDARKRLDFLHRALYDLYLSGNVSVIHSQVDLEGTEGNQTSTERPLQGQSPWVANVQLSYENPDIRTNIALLYNVFGPRIVQVGTAGIPDSYEEPVHRLDVVATQGFGPHWQLRGKFTNLLDWPVRETTGGRTSQEVREGWTAGLAVTWTP